jgi:hypothetical protein
MKMEEEGDSMFLRNVGIDLKIHTAPKLKNSTTTRQLLFMSMGLHDVSELRLPTGL